MWHILALVFIFCFAVSQHALSKDYMVELFEENYGEKMIVGGGEMQQLPVWPSLMPWSITRSLYLSYYGLMCPMPVSSCF